MLQLLHPVEGGARLEPLDLRLVEAVDELQGLLAAVAVLYDRRQRLGGRGKRWFYYRRFSHAVVVVA